MKPIISRPGNPAAANTARKPAFGQERAAQMQQRLNTAIKERRTLAAAQAGAQQTGNQTLQSALAVRERMTERTIDRLHTEVTQDTASVSEEHSPQ